jgi:hypothetical protein
VRAGRTGLLVGLALLALFAVPLGAAGSSTPARVSAVTLPRPGLGAAAACARWQGGSYRVGGGSPVLVTTCTSSSGFPAYVAWIDHARTRLALYPGLSDPLQAQPRGTGAVPSGERWRLLATFNGGFKSSAGAGGFVVDGRVDEPLTVGLGTLVEYRSGQVAILDWEGHTNPATLVLARQNLPPLVWAGRANVTVADAYRWGATLGGGAAVWRTAVGVTARGDLVYVAGDGQTPASLAGLLIRLGVQRAIELDINPEWPSFITYRKRGGADPTAVVPNPQEPSDRYLTPDGRDFFAVYTRAGGGPLVPFR